MVNFLKPSVNKSIGKETITVYLIVLNNKFTIQWHLGDEFWKMCVQMTEMKCSL